MERIRILSREEIRFELRFAFMNLLGSYQIARNCSVVFHEGAFYK